MRDPQRRRDATSAVRLKKLARLRLRLPRHILASHWTARIPARSYAHVNALDHQRAGMRRSNDHDLARLRPGPTAGPDCVRHRKFDAFACSSATQSRLARGRYCGRPARLQVAQKPALVASGRPELRDVAGERHPLWCRFRPTRCTGRRTALAAIYSQCTATISTASTTTVSAAITVKGSRSRLIIGPS